MNRFSGARPSCWLALAVLLAGCAGSAPPSIEPHGGVDAGTLRGTILSDEIFPVLGAIVTLEDGTVATTDTTGAFEFGGLAPGTIGLTIVAVGYEPASQAVEIFPGATAEITILLKGIPGQAPYVETYLFAGYVGCGWAIVFGAGWHAFTPCPFGQNMDSYKVEVGPEWAGGVHEMTWQTSEEMLLASSLVSTCANNGAAGVDPCPALVSGKQPLKIVARPEDAEYAKQYAIDGKSVWPATNYTSYLLIAYTGHARTEINSTLFPACAVVNSVAGSPPEWGCPFGLGAATGLRSDMFHTTFYRQKPADLDSYSAIPDQ